jgi:hypothetical protein
MRHGNLTVSGTDDELTRATIEHDSTTALTFTGSIT